MYHKPKNTGKQRQNIFSYTSLSLFITVICAATGMYAQEKEDIGTETVNVIKSYKAKLPEAVKIREEPILKDTVLLQKKEIDYNIFSVPVASTFVPEKGKVAVMEKRKREVLYNSYVSLGLGNYSSALLDFYTSQELSEDQSFDVGLNHHSSLAQLNETELDTKFFDTRLEASYRNAGRFYRWGLNAGFHHQIYNWYGLPEEAGFDLPVINSIDERHTYYTASVGGQVEAVEESVFTGGELSYKRFWDAESSGENRLIFKPSFEFSISEEQKISTRIVADYVGGEFRHHYYSGEKVKYGNLLLGVNPNYVFGGDDYTINFGAWIFYGMDIENRDNDVYIYPQIEASYRLADEYATLYGGVKGGLDQNSYHDLAQENLFVAPSLFISPTDRKYDAFVGLKGKLSTVVGYNIKATYKAEKNKALYQANPVISDMPNNEGYMYGNSFGVVYDDVTTFSAFGELHADINRNLTLGVNAEVSGYDTDEQEEAWNLPVYKGSLFGDYRIGEHWSAGANMFFVGKRKDLYIPFNSTPSSPEIVDLDGYVDINLRLGYRFNDQVSLFAKANNIANNRYTRWMNYPVQGFQILGGVTYKFDM